MTLSSRRTQPQARSAAAPRRVSVLGSTGSIGCSTLDLIERNPGQYSVEALTGFGNVEKLAGQARRFRPRLAVTGDPNCYQALKDALADTDVEVAAGTPAIIEAASRPADWVMSALVGAAGLEPTLAAVRRGAVVALANKECLVCAGAVLLQDAKRHGATILPVDSEHSAIFQVWDFEHPEAVARIILTASGGPFRRLSSAEMAKATPSQAVAHPNWSMGAKISVDSATMMNKGLELIEAHHLFGLPEERIEILVHPQSVVHSLVAYIDGSVLAQLGTPDMRTPIAYALAWPGRMAAPSPPLDLAAIGTLSFEAPDADRFPALRLAREALRQGGAAPTVLNAANEIAVRGFLNGTIGFSRIAAVVEATLEKVPACDALTLPELLAVDATARYIANELLTL